MDACMNLATRSSDAGAAPVEVWIDGDLEGRPPPMGVAIAPFAGDRRRLRLDRCEWQSAGDSRFLWHQPHHAVPVERAGTLRLGDPDAHPRRVSQLHRMERGRAASRARSAATQTVANRRDQARASRRSGSKRWSMKATPMSGAARLRTGTERRKATIAPAITKRTR